MMCVCVDPLIHSQAKVEASITGKIRELAYVKED